jgi:hypothetical protein
MTPDQQKIDAHLRSLTNDQLLDAMEQAWIDLHEAAQNDNQGERHQACFAACVTYCAEMAVRKLKRRASK